MSGPYTSLTADDYLAAAQALLPRGAAWSRDPDANLTKFLSAVANVAYLPHQSLAGLFEVELDPTQTVDLLPDWEAAFGITARGSQANRRANLKAVITDPGGFSAGHYVALAATLGITIGTTNVIRTGAFSWKIQAQTSLSAALKTALQNLIAQHNRATCTVAFDYSL
jgi:uncharacterized protein YmfQ (DUF2313 family)